MRERRGREKERGERERGVARRRLRYGVISDKIGTVDETVSRQPAVEIKARFRRETRISWFSRVTLNLARVQVEMIKSRVSGLMIAGKKFGEICAMTFAHAIGGVG